MTPPSSRSFDELQASLAAIVESSDDAIISKDLNGIITSWNASAERLFQYTAEEAIGQHITLIIPKERTDEEFIIIGKIRNGQRTEHFETVRQAKDGTLIDVSLTIAPIKAKGGTVIGASKVARDIRDQKGAERTSAYLAAIVNSSDDAIISKDLSGYITSWNNAAEKMFGYTAAEAIGKHITLIIPSDLVDEEFSILSRVKAGLRIEHFETIRQHKNGDLLSISLTVSPITDKKGNLIGASKIARDITRQRQTEESLREMSRRKEEFLANMSHELRTPMNAVIGLAHILSLSRSLNEKEQTYVRTLRESADSLLKLINNLLDFSRLESGSMDLEEVEFSLSETLQKTINVVSIGARDKGISISLSYQEGLRSHYIGDPLRIEQVVTNLLSNAVKFTHEGGIKVRVAQESASDAETGLMIEVADTGIGIPAEKIATIFDKFIQADASTSRKYGGSGLGLSICKALVERMGGSIEVETRVGLGSTFTIHVPLKNGAASGLIEDETTVTAEAVRKNVLVVDDYAPNVTVVTAMLDLLGYSYDLAENGLEAVRKFENGLYDVVLMDVQMHDMDGFESTRRIRAFEESAGRARTPVIAMTAHVRDCDKHQCIEAGMDDFIPKPYEPAILGHKLQAIIEPKSPVPDRR